MTLIMSACAVVSEPDSTNSSIGPTTTTVRSTTTTGLATSTTQPPTTSTTLRPVEEWNIDPTRLMSPLEAFEAFSYYQQWLAWPEPGSEFGWAASGVSVGPSATHCRLSQSSFMGFTPTHEVIYIDDLAWREDVLLATYETTRDEIVDFLEVCPGAPEFWDNTVMTAASLQFDSPRDGGEVAGVRTIQFNIGSSAEALTITAGSIWITEDSVPIKFELVGEGSGAEFQALFGLPPDDAPEHLIFDFYYELAEINGQSLMVRSPDGAVSAGPLGELTAQVPRFEPSDQLTQLLTEAQASLCTNGSVAKRIVEDLGSEPEFDSISVVLEQGNITNHIVGTIVTQGPEERFSTTSDSVTTADLLAGLHYNHHRVLAAWAAFLGFSITFEAVNGNRNSSWDGGTLVRFDGTTEDLSFHVLVHFPDPELEPPESVVDEIRQAIADWMQAADSILTDISTLHPQALVDLEAIWEQRVEIEALLCIELARGWAIADAAYDTFGQGWVSENEQVLMVELAAQQALLILEYLDAIAARLSIPGVDYFRGNDATHEESLTDGVTTDVEFVKVFAEAGRDAVWWYERWTTDDN